MTLTDIQKKSLVRAGIGPLFHDRNLSDYGPLGLGYQKWIKTNWPRLASEGGLVVFHELGQTNELQLVAKGFHINGAGVRIKTLRQCLKTLTRGGEDREEMDDSPVLFLNPAQSGRAGNPLQPWDMADIEGHIQTRVNRNQVVLMYWATDRDLTETDPLWNWWSEDFIAWVQTYGEIITRDTVKAMGDTK